VNKIKFSTLDSLIICLLSSRASCSFFDNSYFVLFLTTECGDLQTNLAISKENIIITDKSKRLSFAPLFNPFLAPMHPWEKIILFLWGLGVPKSSEKFRYKERFSGFELRISSLLVDPFEANQVWATASFIGTNTGSSTLK